MDKKLLIKIIFIVVLFTAIFRFDYCIYMFMRNDTKDLPNSVSYEKVDMFFMARSLTEEFFNLLEKGDYKSAFDMLHSSTKRDLFSSDLKRFENVMKSKYFNSEIGNKSYTINASETPNINTDISFHAYYDVNVFCNVKSLENTNEYYKSKVIKVDAVKNDGVLKIIIDLEK